MNKNPYDVLGISENATDDEIKEAYRALARKYHPDKYIDEGLKEMATAKMQQINEAYDEIKDIRAGKSSSDYSAGSSSGSYSGGYTSGGYSSGGYSYSEPNFAYIRQMINSAQYSAAESELDAVPLENRNAEWNFLRGCILLRKGWYNDAIRYFDTACRMDPNNQEYRNARLQVERMSQTYTRQGNDVCGCGSGNGTGCDCCLNLLCLDACCECCGGDLIACC